MSQLNLAKSHQTI